VAGFRTTITKLFHQNEHGVLHLEDAVTTATRTAVS
jgi:hypothetical protein